MCFCSGDLISRNDERNIFIYKIRVILNSLLNGVVTNFSVKAGESLGGIVGHDKFSVRVYELNL